MIDTTGGLPQASPAMGRLLAAVRARRQAEAAEASAIAELAAEHSWDETRAYHLVEVSDVIDGFRPTLLGVDQIPVDEDLPLEIAAAKQISVTTARWLVRDVVNLRFRHPLMWAKVLAGEYELFRARQVAALVDEAGLLRDAALWVDEQVTPLLGRFGWRRVAQQTRALCLKINPTLARQKADPTARWACTSASASDPTVRYLHGALDTADATLFEATLARVADALARQGVAGDDDYLRAKAVGVLGDPCYAQTLLNATDTSPQPAPSSRFQLRDRFVVHLHADHLNDPDAVVHVEGVGPVLADQVRRLVGHSHIRVTPAVHVGSDAAVDSYDIPDRFRQTVVIRDRYEVFPYSTRQARFADLDHTEPYRWGRQGQTRPGNLGPLSRSAHRAKTHAGWKVVQPQPGVFYWLTRRGQAFKVGPDGTEPITTLEQLRLWAINQPIPDRT
jgi:hypothetical protein